MLRLSVLLARLLPLGYQTKVNARPDPLVALLQPLRDGLTGFLPIKFTEARRLLPAAIIIHRVIRVLVQLDIEVIPLLSVQTH